MYLKYVSIIGLGVSVFCSNSSVYAMDKDLTSKKKAISQLQKIQTPNRDLDSFWRRSESPDSSANARRANEKSISSESPQSSNSSQTPAPSKPAPLAPWAKPMNQQSETQQSLTEGKLEQLSKPRGWGSLPPQPTREKISAKPMNQQSETQQSLTEGKLEQPSKPRGWGSLPPQPTREKISIEEKSDEGQDEFQQESDHEGDDTDLSYADGGTDNAPRNQSEESLRELAFKIHRYNQAKENWMNEGFKNKKEYISHYQREVEKFADDWQSQVIPALKPSNRDKLPIDLVMSLTALVHLREWFEFSIRPDFIKAWLSIVLAPSSKGQRKPILNNFNIRETANAGWAIAKWIDRDDFSGEVVQIDSFFMAFMKHEESLLPKANPQNLSNSLWALAKWMEKKGDTLTDDEQANLDLFVKSFLDQVKEKGLAGFNPQNLSNSLWALAKWMEKKGDTLTDDQQANLDFFVEGFLDQVKGKGLVGFKPQELSISLWALAKWMDKKGDTLTNDQQANLDLFVKSFLDQVEVKGLAGFNPQDLSISFWALAKWMEEKGDTLTNDQQTNLDLFVENFLDQVKGKRLAGFKPQELSNSLWALMLLDFSHLQGLRLDTKQVKNSEFSSDIQKMIPTFIQELRGKRLSLEDKRQVYQVLSYKEIRWETNLSTSEKTIKSEYSSSLKHEEKTQPSNQSKSEKKLRPRLEKVLKALSQEKEFTYTLSQGHWDEVTGASVDYWLELSLKGGRKITLPIEFDGPVHFTKDREGKLIPKLTDTLADWMWKKAHGDRNPSVFHIPYWEYGNLKSEDSKEAYLREKLLEILKDFLSDSKTRVVAKTGVRDRDSVLSAKAPVFRPASATTAVAMAAEPLMQASASEDFTGSPWLDEDDQDSAQERPIDLQAGSVNLLSVNLLNENKVEPMFSAPSKSKLNAKAGKWTPDCLTSQVETAPLVMDSMRISTSDSDLSSGGFGDNGKEKYAPESLFSPSSSSGTSK